LRAETTTLLDQRFPAEPAQLCEIRHQVAQLVETQGLETDRAAEIALALSEAVANIVEHGYRGEAGHDVRLQVIREPGRLVFLLDDDAPCVDPKTIRPRPLKELRPGGLGVHLMRAIMNDVTYQPRAGGGNRLRMTREL
jgi:anti-sigma regulatory factor (Ser/Thr protein kinase)